MYSFTFETGFVGQFITGHVC